MFVGFQHARIESLTNLWNDCLPEPYQISPEVFRANTVDSGVFDWGASVIHIDDDAHPLGFVIVKKSAASLYHGPDSDISHISAVVCPDPNQGVDLFSYVKKNLANRGVYKAVFGRDVRHFFAGCPSDFTSLKDFLTVEGFEHGGEFWDVSRDISTYEPPSGVSFDEARIEPLKAQDVEALDRFLRDQFPGRWHYDTMSKTASEGSPEFIMGLWLGKELKGFAITQWAGHTLPLGGGVFPSSLGPDWCALGPIGVGKDVRKKGLGDALLAASLLRLKAMGKRRCIIDWTVLKDWYGKHGFEPYRTYTSCSLRLDEPD